MKVVVDLEFSFEGAPLFFVSKNYLEQVPGKSGGAYGISLECQTDVNRAPFPSTYDEPTVMWRMKRSDGLSAHAVIGFQGNGAWVIWFLNGRPMGVRDFDDCTSALQWSDRMQFQNWTVGWRDTSLSTDRES